MKNRPPSMPFFVGDGPGIDQRPLDDAGGIARAGAPNHRWLLHICLLGSVLAQGRVAVCILRKIASGNFPRICGNVKPLRCETQGFSRHFLNDEICLEPSSFQATPLAKIHDGSWHRVEPRLHLDAERVGLHMHSTVRTVFLELAALPFVLPFQKRGHLNGSVLH